MKILISVPEKQDCITDKLYETSDQNSMLTVVEHNTVCKEEYDITFTYTGVIENEVNDEIIHSLTHGCPEKTTFLIPYHYSSSFSGVTLDKIVVTPVLFFKDPYKMLLFLNSASIVERKDITNESSFVLTEDNRVQLFVTDKKHTEAINLMPVLPTTNNACSNFNVKQFFNCDYINVSNIRKRGHSFWKLQHYNIWDSFNNDSYN